jgi:hypothetical protein
MMNLLLTELSADARANRSAPDIGSSEAQ